MSVRVGYDSGVLCCLPPDGAKLGLLMALIVAVNETYLRAYGIHDCVCEEKKYK